MSDAAFVHSIRHCYELFEALGQVRLFRLPTSLPVSLEFNEVALDVNAGYADVFMRALRLSHYNIQLRDFSFFQFARRNDEEIRLAFYPSPYGSQEFAIIASLTAKLEQELLDVEAYSYLIGMVKTNPRRPLIRYEFSKSQYVRGKHPASHFHFGTYGDDRWVVQRKLSPLAFGAMVAKLYFSEDWEAATEQDAEGIRLNEFDLKYFNARVACPACEDELFTGHESSQFHVI